ncbi:hypothetical protein ACE6H2_005998 [Prunus campanulata]
MPLVLEFHSYDLQVIYVCFCFGFCLLYESQIHHSSFSDVKLLCFQNNLVGLANNCF